MTTLPPDPAETPPPGPMLRLFGRQFGLPRSRLARTGVGVTLILFGSVGFLPVLGFWMIPLGLLVLATDSPRVRRFNRRSGVWLKRRWGGRAGGSNGKP